MDRTNDTIMFYTVDGASWDANEPYYPDLGNAFVYNQDYAVFKRAFVFDLSFWGDEAPCDEPFQPIGSDLNTMKELLQRKYDQFGGQKMITVCGFVPWHVKYTSHGGKGKHEAVSSEWRFTEILSAYNCIKDADAAGLCSLANASVYCQYPLKPRYENHKPTLKTEYDPDTRYILLYIGDYDASAWTARFIPKWYRDPALGSIPMMWCFNPNLSDRIPQAFDFIYNRYTQNDVFAAGDSGAGYNNPRLCYEPRVHSNNPSCIEVWNAYNRKYFEQFDLSVIGFVIDGDVLISEREMQDMSTYATPGVGYLKIADHLPTKIVNGSVFMPVSWDVSAPGVQPIEAARTILDRIHKEESEKRFYIFRTILSSPSHIKEIMEQVKRLGPDTKFEFPDPYSFFTMAKKAKEQNLCY